jgi:aminobenzoyl-glutamate transport protein
VGFITERIIEPRLGKYTPEQSPGEQPAQEGASLSAAESRGLTFALLGLVGVLVVVGLLTLPPGAPLRNPTTGDLIGNSPFMNGLIAVIMVLFLVTGAAYGFGAGTMKSSTDIIKAIEKSLSGLGPLIFLFFIISQFVAYFNYTNMGTILAVSLANVLKDANIGALPLLIGFIVVVAIIDLLITGAIAKWAIFAPIFVPLLMKLGVNPKRCWRPTELAIRRRMRSHHSTPTSRWSSVSQKYDKNAGVGTVVSLMLPYVVIMFVLWTVLFAVWQMLDFLGL